MKKVLLSIVIVVVLAASLCSCSTDLSSDIELNDDMPNKNASDEIIPPEVILPFNSSIDILDSFDEKNVSFDENQEKIGLICEDLDTSSYAQSETTITVSDTSPQDMVIHCTWLSAARTVYIGFMNVASEDVYTISAVGGTISGTLSLDDLPDGEYKVIMYSSDNENIHAVMLYQFHNN